MNILFLGNSQILTAIRHLPKLLNQLPNNDLYIEMVYVAAANVTTLLRNFKMPMSTEYIVTKTHSGNIIWRYVYGQDRWDEMKFPDVSIQDVLKSKEWDIIITCGHTGKNGVLNYDRYTEKYKKFFREIRRCSKAKIYWLCGLTPNREFCDTQIYDECSGGSRRGMLKYLNVTDKKICNDYHLKSIPMRQAYEILVEQFPGYNGLVMDNIHPDRGVGEYFCTAYLYNFFFKPIYGVDLSELRFSYDASKHKYKNTDIQCISVDEKTKKIVDDVVNFCYI